MHCASNQILICSRCGADLAADFLAGEVLVLQVALLDLLLGCQHDSCHSHPELLQHMLGPHHLPVPAMVTVYIVCRACA